MKRKGAVPVLLFIFLFSVSWAAGAQVSATTAARQKFFGAENVDANTGTIKKDKVIFSWITNASYAVSVLGRVILLDTWVTRAESVPGRTPFVVQDLVDLHPEAIFLGHGHGDHADNAAYIAKSLNIPIYTSPETCDAMQADAALYFGAGSTVNCVGIISRGSLPGAEVVRLNQLEPLACIVAFRHIHSTTVPYDPTFPPVTIQNIADPRDAAMYPTGTPLSYPTTGGAGPGGPLALFYQFVLRAGYNFTFVWHNSTGPVKEGRGPDVTGQPGSGNFGPAIGQRLFDVMDSLPRTDVHFGAVVSLGYPTNGERDIVMYDQHLRSKIYVPIHQDVAAVPSSSPEWRIGWLQQNEAMGIPPSQRSEIRWMVDPLDYLRPLVYTPGDPRWQDPTKAAPLQHYCG